MLKKIEKWMLKNPPGPRLTDALRLSGSEPNRVQEERAKKMRSWEVNEGKQFFQRETKMTSKS